MEINMNRLMWLLIAVLAIGLFQTTAAWALSSEVTDGGNFFSADTEKSVNASIADIRSTFNKDVLVETFAEIPESRKAQYSPGKKDEFFSSWVRERADATDLNGVYILICKNPSVLRVSTGTKTRQTHFTNPNRDEVVALMLSKFKEKKFDEGLSEGVALIKQRMSENVSGKVGRNVAPAPAAKSSGMGMLGTVILIGLGVWLLFGIMRAFSGGGMSGNGGGGGFMSGMMGGLFGAVVGNMMYNSFFGGSAHGGDYGGSSDSSGSSDYGSDNGGGFDSGGGDFGGGDSGGGGDF